MHVYVAGKHCHITEECAAHHKSKRMQKVTQWTILVCICSTQAAVKLQCESIMCACCFHCVYAQLLHFFRPACASSVKQGSQCIQVKQFISLCVL